MIQTARLTLRRARPDDLADLHQVMRDPRAMQYWSTPPHPDLGTTAVWLDRKLAEDLAGSVEFVMEYQGRAIGTAGGGVLPEVGYILHPDYWGKGFAFEAMQAIIAYAFANHPVDHLMADVDPRNAASIKLLKRLGFVFTSHAQKTFCIAGEWVHSDYYRLNRPVTAPGTWLSAVPSR
jgi:ribosomal-protein-alanine N-acetyltransferase